MINHLRTLILNLAGPGGTDYDQFIPDGFRPVALVADELRVWNQIFNPDHPRDYREFIATALTRLVRGTPIWESHILPLDERETIDWTLSQVTTLSPSVTLRKIRGTSLVDVFGTFSPDLEKGIFSNSWKITATGTLSATVEDARLGSSRAEALVFTNGASNAIQLEPRSKLYFRFTNQPSVFPVISEVTATAPPQIDVLALWKRFRQDNRIRPFITSLGIPELGSFYDDQLSPMNAVAAALAAYCISITRRLDA